MFWLPGLCCKTPMYPGSSLTSSEQFLRAIWEAATWAWSPQKVCQIKQFSTFRLWIFFQLTKIRIQFHSFSCRYPDFPSTICWRDYPFPILFSWKFCWRLVYHIHLDLFLGSILFHWSPCLSLFCRWGNWGPRLSRVVMLSVSCLLFYHLTRCFC